jgi:hypothetical protein
MSKRDLERLMMRASNFAESAMQEHGEVASIWHMIAADGQEIVELTPPFEDKDAAIGMIKAMFALADVVRYVHFTEAWTLDYRGEKARAFTKEEIDQIKREGVRNHPDRVEVVMFQAEDNEFGMMTGHREIIRETGKPPYLGPMQMFEGKQSEGRLVGLLPRKGSLQ